MVLSIIVCFGVLHIDQYIGLLSVESRGLVLTFQFHPSSLGLRPGRVKLYTYRKPLPVLSLANSSNLRTGQFN